MSNTQAPDSTVQPSTTPTQPALPVVKPSPDKQDSGSGSIDTTALSQQIADKVREDLRREIREAQSDKDRRLKSYEQDKSRIDEIYGYIKKYPDNPDQALREYRVDQLLQHQPESVNPQADLGKVQPKGLEQRARDILAKSKLTDPTEQLEIMQGWAQSTPPGGYNNDDDAIAGIADFIADFKIAKSKRDAPVSAASVSAPLGGATTPADVESITGKLAELQKGNLNDPANIAARAALSEKLKKLRTK
jgi:hypothetical protein